MNTDQKRSFLRHTLATVAYRAAKVERFAPPGFGDFQLGKGARTPLEIIAHLGDLFDWALRLAKGNQEWVQSKPQSWRKEVARLHASLLALDQYLASDAPLSATPEELFQGPISDALTHVGQVAVLRRQAGAPVRSEVFVKADIAAGRVGEEQPKNPLEFDGAPADPKASATAV
ncbi:MAG TPA: hypothetical protein VJ840_03165 [Gemmatimonadaceae bacterium]|nr:hypothetical protein [Gemmatimonadaceae bacterium]